MIHDKGEESSTREKKMRVNNNLATLQSVVWESTQRMATNEQTNTIPLH